MKQFIDTTGRLWFKGELEDKATGIFHEHRQHPRWSGDDDLDGAPPFEFGKFIAAETEKWAKVIRISVMTPLAFGNDVQRSFKPKVGDVGVDTDRCINLEAKAAKLVQLSIQPKLGSPLARVFADIKEPISWFVYCSARAWNVFISFVVSDVRYSPMVHVKLASD